MAVDFASLPKSPLAGGEAAHFGCYHIDGASITSVSVGYWQGPVCTSAPGGGCATQVATGRTEMVVT